MDNQREPTRKVTTEELFKMASYKHAAAQQPWDAMSVQYWQGAANALGWVLRAKGLNDRQLNEMEDDGIALGKQGRWDHTLDGLCEPDGTVELD